MHEAAMERGGGQFVHQVMARLNRTFNGATIDVCHDAASRIQSRHRGNAQRRLSRRERRAAAVIQSRWRGGQGRAKIVSMKDAVAAAEAEDAAVRIQSRMRGRQGRRAYQSQLEEQLEKGASRIQSSFRGMKGRRSAKVEREYIQRVQELERKAMRMFTNRAVGGVFSAWLGWHSTNKANKVRAVKMFSGGAVLRAFEGWSQAVGAIIDERAGAVLDVIQGLVEACVRSDPDELLRDELLENGVEDPAEIYDRVKHAHHERGVRTPPSAQPPGKMLAPKAKAAGLWGKLTGRIKMKPPTGGVQLRIVATRRDVARAHAAGHASINAPSTLQRDLEAHQDAQAQRNKMVVSIEICSTLNIAARAGTKLCCHMRVGDAVDPPATVPDGRVQSKGGTAGDPRVQWGCKTVIVVDDVATDCINCIITEEGGAPKLGQFSIGLKELVEIERTREATAGATKSWPLTAWRESWLTVKSPPPTLQLKAAWAPKEKILSVTVIGAYRLPNDGGFDVSDPYCRLDLISNDDDAEDGKLGLQKQQTKAFDNTLDPVWDESFAFVEVGNSLRDVGMLRLTVLDKDFLSADVRRPTGHIS
jgi:hypothetical protein